MPSSDREKGSDRLVLILNDGRICHIFTVDGQMDRVVFLKGPWSAVGEGAHAGIA